MDRKALFDPNRIKLPGSRMIGQRINRAFPSGFLMALTFNIDSMVDSLLAGIFFTPVHIAAIGIVLPVRVLLSSVLQILIQGTYAGYTTALARGQRRKCREVFTAGLLQVACLGTLFAVLSIAFAPQIVRLFGAATGELRELAAQYLRYTSLTLPIVGITKLVTLLLVVYGHQKSAMFANAIELGFNAVLSVLFLRMIPSIGFGALGLGTMFAAVPAVVACFLSLKRHNLPRTIGMRPAALRAQRMAELLRGGMSVSLNSFIDGAVGALVNNIIASSALGAEGLAMYSVVLCFWQLSCIPAEGMDYAYEPMFGVCYNCRDKRGLKDSFMTAMISGAVYSTGWILLIFMMMAPLLRLYINSGIDAASALATVRGGVLITLIFTPLRYIITTQSCFYDCTDSVLASIIFAVVPDSVLMPLMLTVLLPLMGYNGIWLALGGNTLVFLLGWYIAEQVRQKRRRPALDKLLRLDKGQCADYPMIDLSVRRDDKDISRVSERIQHFLEKENVSSRTAYMTALCIDELATDLKEHTVPVGGIYTEHADKYENERLLELKIVSENDMLMVVIFNPAEPYDPLDFVYSNDDYSKIGLNMVQRIAKKIDYAYIYKMNMITIKIEK